jgi:hypothetical protein
MMVKDRVIRRMAKNSPKFGKSSPNSSQTKKSKLKLKVQSIYTNSYFSLKIPLGL